MKKIFFLFFVLLPFAVFAALAPIVNVEESFGVMDIAVTPDGNTIILAVTDGSIRQIQASSGRQLIPSAVLPKKIASIAITDNGNKLFIASDKLYLMTLKDQSLKTIDGSASGVIDVSADKNGAYGATVSGRQLTFYNLTSGRTILTVRTPSEQYAVGVSGGTQSLYIAGKDSIVREYSYNGELLKEYKTAIGVIRAISVQSDYVFAGGEKGIAKINITTNSVDYLSRSTDDVKSLDITPNGRFLLAGSDDGSATTWDLAGSTAENTTGSSPIVSVAIDPLFRYVVYSAVNHGDIGGRVTIQYTANKYERRDIYTFRDATLTLDDIGHADGIGLFGKYINYTEGKKSYSFTEVANIVHKPAKLNYNMKIPTVAQSTPQVSQAKVMESDTEPPIITVNERGLAEINADEIRVISGKITDHSGVAWAKVDGKPLKLSSEGFFSIEVPKISTKSMVISAADNYGNTAEKTINLDTVNKVNDSNNKKIALIIGINNYKHLPALKTPEFDARTVAEILKNNYSYETVTLFGKDATRDGIMGELNRLRKSLGNEDKLLIYYAGHGYLDFATGNAYWQPFDAGEDDTRWILTSQITSNISASQASQILIIADSCYSGAVNPLEGNRSRVLISSGANEPVADLSDDGHSLFTNALLKTLEANPTEAKELFQKTVSNLPKGSKQTPRYIIISGSGEYNF